MKFRINDVGQGTWEEVDEGDRRRALRLAVPGGPRSATRARHPCNSPTTDPVLFYNHSTGCNVETGGAFVPPGDWPGYDGAYLFVDFGCGQLFVAQPGQTGTQSSVLATGLQQTTDLRFFPSTVARRSSTRRTRNGGELHKVIGPPPPSPPGTIPDTKFIAVQPERVLDTRDREGRRGGQAGTRFHDHGEDHRWRHPRRRAGGRTEPDRDQRRRPRLRDRVGQPAGAFPPTSSLNLSDLDETAANAVVVPVGQGGQISLYTRGGTHLVADVTGYFTGAGATTDGRFEAAPTPTRVLDTRTGPGGKAGAVRRR